MTHNWLILRVLHGRPLHIERVINERGLANAYCPARGIRRPHPRGKEIIMQRKPMIPGYLFLENHFDLECINGTTTRVAWLMSAGRLAYLNEFGMAALRASEAKWQPDLIDIAHALHEIARGLPARRHRYIQIGDFQAIAKADQCGISAV